MEFPLEGRVLIPVFLFFCLMTTAVVSVIGKYWSDMRRQQIEADLKMEMLHMGMTAEDIVRVVQAKQGSRPRQDDRAKNFAKY